VWRQISGFGVGGCVVLALASTVTLAGVPAAAANPRPSTVLCQQYSASRSTHIPPAPVDYSWQFSGCSDLANTGGSGTGTLVSQGAAGDTVLITWSAGKTTTILLSVGNKSKKPGCPADAVSEFHQTGMVLADTTGSIRIRRVSAIVCTQVFEGPFGTTVVESNLPGTSFKL
jgi:hypothetical protein